MLGRMLLDGREAGEIGAHGGDRINVRGADLGDFGVERNLAADAVAFASLDAERWQLIAVRVAVYPAEP